MIDIIGGYIVNIKDIEAIFKIRERMNRKNKKEYIFGVNMVFTDRKCYDFDVRSESLDELTALRNEAVKAAFDGTRPFVEIDGHNIFNDAILFISPVVAGEFGICLRTFSTHDIPDLNGNREKAIEAMKNAAAKTSK